MKYKIFRTTITRGFTLYELIIVMSIFLVAIFITTTYIVQGLKANRFVIEFGEAVQNARRGTEIMAKELREASFADNGNFPIVSASDQILIFYSDIDSDNAIERVRYFLDGTDLKKGVIEPSGDPIVYTGTETITIISQYVRNDTVPIFYFYNGDYPADVVNNPLTIPPNLNEIKLINLNLFININPLLAPNSFNLNQAVQLRNLKSNL